MTRFQRTLTWLERHRDLDEIKIISGVRGCGKTHLLDAYAARLAHAGVPQTHILRINLAQPNGTIARTPEELVARIKSHMTDDRRTYLLLDEVCELENVGRALDELFVLKRHDIVATSSNLHPFADDSFSSLNSRVEMLPPAFSELPFREGMSFDRRLASRLRYSALPYTFQLREAPHAVDVYLLGLWNTILVRDIFTYNRMSDVRLVEYLMERLFDHLGETESLRRISNDLSRAYHEVAPNTVLSYVSALDGSLLMRRVPKFDVFLGEPLRSGYRFYLADPALGRARYGGFPLEPQSMLRNLIYLELIAHVNDSGGKVYCGRIGKLDFDFVTVVRKSVHCWQFAPAAERGEIPADVLAPFTHIPVDIPRTVITNGFMPKTPPRGIEVVTLEDFLSANADDGITP